LLARPRSKSAAIVLTPIWIVWAVATLWYLALGNLALGLRMSAWSTALLIYLACAALAAEASRAGSPWGIGTFVVGWVIQFVGHYYEGKKPAFVDDLLGF
jgi:uncharacterized membrane protein YGL010W